MFDVIEIWSSGSEGKGVLYGEYLAEIIRLIDDTTLSGITGGGTKPPTIRINHRKFSYLTIGQKS